MRNFDIVAIDPTIDWFNIMTYDIHGTWDSTDPSIGAIAQAHTNLTEIQLSLELLWRNHIDPSRGTSHSQTPLKLRPHADTLLVNLGLGFYGRSKITRFCAHQKVY
jgi:chitinase